MTAARVVRGLGWLVLVAMLALVAFTAVWRIQGGRIERVETPSMGTVAPVGSLLWVKPVDVSGLRTGDFITFHPPGEPGTTYSHRVRHVYADGTIGTQGVLTAPDPWRLQPTDIVGRVKMTWPMVGWLVRLAPVLALGGFLVAFVVSRLRRRWRGAAVLIGASLVLCTAIVVYRPLVSAEQLAFAPDGHGARATYVSTGMLPVRLQADVSGGAHVDLHAGQMGSVRIPTSNDKQQYGVRLSPAVPFRFWVVLVVGCFLPGLFSSVRSRRRRATFTGAGIGS
jgi:hypothetical protein